MGVIMIGDDKPRLFSNEEIRLVTLFAEQAAVAVENANLYEFLDSPGEGNGFPLPGFFPIN